MSDLPDYYALLGVPEDADQRTIERAYRRLARQYHPDLNPTPDAHARMAVINEAYAVLRDPQRRRAYDAQRAIVRELQRRAPLDGTPDEALDDRQRFDRLHLALRWERHKRHWEETFLRLVTALLRAYGYRFVRQQPAQDQAVRDQLWVRRGQLWYVRIHFQPVAVAQDVSDFVRAAEAVPKAKRVFLGGGAVLPPARLWAKTNAVAIYDRAELRRLLERVRRARGKAQKRGS